MKKYVITVPEQEFSFTAETDDEAMEKFQLNAWEIVDFDVAEDESDLLEHQLFHQDEKA